MSRLLWFCIATLCDWLKDHVPLYQPIRRKTKTIRDLHARVFPPWRRLHVLALSFDWFIGLSASVVIDQSNTQLKTALTGLKYHTLRKTPRTANPSSRNSAVLMLAYLVL